MGISLKVKIALQKEASSAKKALKAGGLKLAESMKLQKRWREIIKQLKGDAGDKPSTLVADYLAGKFNGLPMDQFFEKIDAVEAEGAELEQIKEGARVWVIHNAESLGLAA